MKINMEKNLPILIVIFALSLSAWTYIKAQGTEISVCVKKTGVMYMIGDGFQRKNCLRNDQLVSWNIAGQFSASDFYYAPQGWFEVQKSVSSFFGYGCDSSTDIAIAGGPAQTTGGDKYWRTILNRPDIAAMDSWGTSIIYDGPDSTAQVLLVLKCLRVKN